MQNSQIHFQGLLQRAEISFAQGHYDEAKLACRQMLKIKKKSPEPIKLLARIAWNEHQRDEALHLMTKALQLEPRNFASRTMLANWLMYVGRGGEAALHFERAMKLRPEEPFALSGLAASYLSVGKLDVAERMLRSRFEEGHKHWSLAVIFATVLHDQKKYEESVCVAERYVDDPNLDDDSRRRLCFLLGKSLENLGDVESSFSYYQRAHRNIASTFDVKRLNDDVHQMIDAYSPAVMARLPRATLRSRLPVFIISRPRAGSTLIERIISSHPKAHAGGELSFLRQLTNRLPLHVQSSRNYPHLVQDFTQDDVNRLSKEYLEKLQPLAPTASRITVKSLGNWNRAGFINLILPEARLIDLRRDAVDTCFSCYTSMLDLSHNYVHNLRDVALAYCAYEALMRHWNQTLDMPRKTVSYELLVADQSSQTGELLDFCGLPWHDDCLNFHQSSNAGRPAAMTLSYNQVRRPIYQSSVRRAEKFSAYLEPLHEGLVEGRKYWGLDSDDCN